MKGVESNHRFYDSEQDSYYVFSMGFFYCYKCVGDDCQTQYDKGMKTLHKALFPNSTLTYDEEIARARMIAGLPPKPQSRLG